MSPHFRTSTAYFPPLRWFLAGTAAGQWMWEAQEHYQKGGWRNRCRIATANGPLRLSVPLRGGKHRQTPIRSVEICYRNDWWRVHEQTLRSAYGRSPYFEFYAADLFAVARTRPATLWALNRALVGSLCTLLSVADPVQPTASFRDGGADAGATLTTEGNPPYPQVFTERHGFLDGLSVLDGLFCLGPELLRLPPPQPARP